VNNDPSWQLERDAFLAMSPPRHVPQAMIRAVLPWRGQVMMMIFGFVFLAMGLFFSWVFVPNHLLLDWKLKQGSTLSVPGKILSAEETNMSINSVKVTEYRFAYLPDSGGERQGTAYTTGRRWRSGSRVRVNFLQADPTLAVPEGARLSKTSVGTLFVLLFPMAGGGILIGCFYSRHVRKRLLRHGWVSRATVDSVDKTRTVVNGQNIFKIHLTFPEAGRSVVKRSLDGAEISLAEEALHSSHPLQVLYDPNKPKRFLFPEVWKA
jgi:hypothetical protein